MPKWYIHTVSYCNIITILTDKMEMTFKKSRDRKLTRVLEKGKNTSNPLTLASSISKYSVQRKNVTSYSKHT